MYRHWLLFIIFGIVGISAYAGDDQPVVEMKADRTIIYPQRMVLTGEESLMDVLQMMPDLMVAGYEDVAANYSLRIDNSPMNGDARMILSTMKAKNVAKIQVCENTGVAKGTIAMGRVLDINMAVNDTLKGTIEGQGGIGRNMEGIGNVNVLYGSSRTDVYGNATYRHLEGNKTYLTLHMTNRLNNRNRLLTYFTQQYLELPDGASRKVMGRARYFHTFNDIGTELLLVGSYQYASDQATTNQLPLYTIELNTPLFSRRLFMMLGVESDFQMTRLRQTEAGWDVFNRDAYLQLTYTLDKWRWSVGTRVMYYDYKVKGEGISRQHTDTRDNTYISVIYVPSPHHQLHGGYYRKFYNPVCAALFANDVTISDEDWAITKGQLDEQTIRQMMLAYVYSKTKVTVKAETSYYAIEGNDNMVELGTSAYWKTKGASLTGGVNLYATKHGGHAAFRLAPTVSLPGNWQIGLQTVYYTKKAPRRQVTGVPVYGCLTVNKLIGRHWMLGVDWHDMFDTLDSRKVAANRHAANVRLQYRL